MATITHQSRPNHSPPSHRRSVHRRIVEKSPSKKHKDPSTKSLGFFFVEVVLEAIGSDKNRELLCVPSIRLSKRENDKEIDISLCHNRSSNWHFFFLSVQ
ncbi:uncharacterized protein G2W53_044557 [Senna tora]|uniref:Uncharacterized protein n=1 Tax=Senna tora TaxID=362788 RepID=A0A834SCE3_9FABA|nr:uncharacterized protein G2W53_044557 [Senna tora]